MSRPSSLFDQFCNSRDAVMNFFGKLRSATLRMAFRMALSAIGFCAGWAASIPPALAATSGLTDISQEPLVTSISTAVKPILMYIMDTSGSMAWSFMPDTVGNNSTSNCYKNYIYNGVYYNPGYTYAPPVDYLGNSYANS